MSFHIVTRGERWRKGTWFECLDHGCTEVEIETVENRVRVKREVGFILPYSEIEPYVMTVMKRGLKRNG